MSDPQPTTVVLIAVLVVVVATCVGVHCFWQRGIAKHEAMGAAHEARVQAELRDRRSSMEEGGSAEGLGRALDSATPGLQLASTGDLRGHGSVGVVGKPLVFCSGPDPAGNQPLPVMMVGLSSGAVTVAPEVSVSSSTDTGAAAAPVLLRPAPGETSSSCHE